MDGVAVKPLTVGFHETPFLTKLNQENQLGFWFQLSGEERQHVGSPWGPANPQNLNRYSYVLNNPLRYTDPTGHYYEKGGDEEVGYETACQVNGKISSCDAPGAEEYKQDGRTVVRAWVTNSDGSKSERYYYQNDEDFESFRTAVRDYRSARVTSEEAVATAAGATAGAYATCYATAIPAPMVCGAALVGVLVYQGYAANRVAEYHEARRTAYRAFRFLGPGISIRR